VEARDVGKTGLTKTGKLTRHEDKASWEAKHPERSRTEAS